MRCVTNRASNAYSTKIPTEKSPFVSVSLLRAIDSLWMYGVEHMAVLFNASLREKPSAPYKLSSISTVIVSI
jgi:hypothetical protein